MSIPGWGHHNDKFTIRFLGVSADAINIQTSMYLHFIKNCLGGLPDSSVFQVFQACPQLTSVTSASSLLRVREPGHAPLRVSARACLGWCVGHVYRISASLSTTIP